MGCAFWAPMAESLLQNLSVSSPSPLIPALGGVVVKAEVKPLAVTEPLLGLPRARTAVWGACTRVVRGEEETGYIL